jgi:recombinational DNA repair protein (RecF pathway)
MYQKRALHNRNCRLFLFCYNHFVSYAIYTTHGFVLSSAPSGEASKTYAIYTQDFGLIFARAQGVRLLSSKLRYSLDNYIFGKFSLVKGKEVWRITGAEAEPVRVDSLARARILNLVRRLVQGEEKNEKLFESLLELHGQTLSETDALGKVLAALGYLDLNAFETKSDKEKVFIINKALKETQL